MSDRYPRSRPSPIDKSYWEGLQVDEFRVQRCMLCHRYQWYPSPACVSCYAEKLEWVPVEPIGTVYSYTITHQRTGFAFDARAPFVFAVVEIVTARPIKVGGLLTLADPYQVAIGMPVKGRFTRQQTGDDSPVVRLEFVEAEEGELQVE